MALSVNQHEASDNINRRSYYNVTEVLTETAVQKWRRCDASAPYYVQSISGERCTNTTTADKPILCDDWKPLVYFPPDARYNGTAVVHGQTCDVWLWMAGNDHTTFCGTDEAPISISSLGGGIFTEIFFFDYQAGQPEMSVFEVPKDLKCPPASKPPLD